MVKNLPAYRSFLQMQETWVPSLEKGIFSILAWRIPWTEGPGELQYTGITKNRTQLSD